MTSFPANSDHHHDSILAQLRQEFVDDALERLLTIQSVLAGPLPIRGDALISLHRELHNLKGMGAAFGFPTITLLSHRMEDYLTGRIEIGQPQINDLLVFSDFMADLMAAGEELSEESTANLVRQLPRAKSGVAFASGPEKSVEILLAIPAKSIGLFLSRELGALGYRVTQVSTPWDAFEIAIRARPDLIITPVEMHPLGGIDFVRALRAMDSTKKLNVAVLTSYARAHPSLRTLPPDVPILRLGKTLDDELATLLHDCGII
jgi:CheY-like chemotaxis protein/HPt (histidine-containing phosphotransfer) domain-containing protein|tara:strand:- start:5724 stop:6509 length:786 start_codon:yes stop_codon:yes gene_type:complete